MTRPREIAKPHFVEGSTGNWVFGDQAAALWDSAAPAWLGPYLAGFCSRCRVPQGVLLDGKCRGCLVITGEMSRRDQ